MKPDRAKAPGSDGRGRAEPGFGIAGLRFADGLTRRPGCSTNRARSGMLRHLMQGGDRNQPELRPELFRRVDESPDALFYREPRLVTHIDDATIEALTKLYRELLPAGGRVLDLMSSWVSHLPPEIHYARVAGLGMNRADLERNPRLDEHCVHDLNADPELPYPDQSFDAVVNAVSVQYLIRPVEVFASVRRVLAPGGLPLIGGLLADYYDTSWPIPYFMIPSPGYLSFATFDETFNMLTNEGHNYFYKSFLCVHLMSWGFLFLSCL